MLGAQDYVPETQSQVFARYQAIPDLGKLVRIEATPALLWVSRACDYSFDQLMINLRGTLLVDRQQAGVQDPCVLFPNAQTIAPSTTSR